MVLNVLKGTSVGKGMLRNCVNIFVKILYTYNKEMNNRIKHMETQKQAVKLRKETGRNYTRKDLNILAKAAGIKYFCKFTKHGLTEKLGIQLTEKKRPLARGVEICKTNERYPSMIQAAKAYGIFPAQVYVMVAKGEAKFL